MAKKEKEKKALDKAVKEAFVATQDHRQGLLKILGVDAKKLKEQERKTDRKIKAIAARVGDEFRAQAQEISEVHTQALYSLRSKRAIWWPWFRCCGTEDMVRPEDEITLTPPDDANRAKGSVTWEEATNTCRPQLELHGAGTHGTIKCAMVFILDPFRDNCPSRDGRYRIQAYAQANGFYWLWPYGTGGCGVTGTAEQGSLTLKARIIVKQADIELCRSEVVLAEAESHEYPSSIDLNRYIRCYANLSTEWDVIIRVEFEIDGRIDSGGHCIVDLQSSKFFYFRVPRISLCYQPYLVLAEPIRPRVFEEPRLIPDPGQRFSYR